MTIKPPAYHPCGAPRAAGGGQGALDQQAITAGQSTIAVGRFLNAAFLLMAPGPQMLSPIRHICAAGRP